MTNFWFFKKDSKIKIFLLDNYRPYTHENIHNNFNNRIIIIDDNKNNFIGAPKPEDFIGRNKEENLENKEKNYKNWIDMAKDDSISEVDENYYKNKKIYDYYLGNFYGNSITSLIYKLLIDLNRLNKRIFWLLIISETDMFINNKISLDEYEIKLKNLKNDSFKFNSNLKSKKYFEVEEENSKKTIKLKTERKEIGSIIYQKEINIYHLRHWNLYDSLLYSKNTLSSLKTWNDPSSMFLNKLITKMNIPLKQTKENYEYMDIKYKDKLKENILNLSKDFNLGIIVLGNFLKQLDSSCILSSTDIVYSAYSTLMNYNKIKTEDYSHIELIKKINDLNKENYYQIYNNILEDNKNSILDAIKLSQIILKDIYSDAKAIINANKIYKSNYFRYIKINSSWINQKYINNNQYLINIIQLLSNIYEVSNMKDKYLPILLCLNDEIFKRYKIIGIINEKINFNYNKDKIYKNLFGSMFKEAIQNLDEEITYSDDYFDNSIIEVSYKDFDKFFNKLKKIIP